MKANEGKTIGLSVIVSLLINAALLGYFSGALYSTVEKIQEHYPTKLELADATAKINMQIFYSEQQLVSIEHRLDRQDSRINEGLELRPKPLDSQA